MRRLLGAAVTLLLTLALGAAPAQAQCPAGAVDFQGALDAYMQERVKKEVPGITEAAIRDTPRFTVRGQQDAAPSANGSNATIVDAASFSSLFSAAFDQTVGTGSGDDDDLLTFNLSPFMLAAAYDSDVYYDQVRYELLEYDIMRRIGATVSFGGKGESFDRDGDGMDDEPLSADSLDDIVTWEARFRVWGSRDRRDPANYNAIFAAMEGPVKEMAPPGTASLEEQQRSFALQMDMANRLAALLLDPRLVGYKVAGNLACIDSTKWEELEAAPWFKAYLDDVAAAFVRANSTYLAATEEVDQQLLVTAVLTGVERSEEFGPDQFGLGVRATWYDFTGNFDWSQTDTTGIGTHANQFGIGLEWGRPILRDLVGGSGVDASLAAAVDIYNNVPEAAHDTIVKVQGALEIPITEGVTLPLSITWANYEDLLSDDDTIVGRFGINIDTSTLMNFVRPQTAATP